jgi:demethylmenaquinone methyltransferase/2-methoxy-6-polyprenyl-1,4-benzoquinol methylase
MVSSEKVKALFNEIAGSYDFLNRFFSFGIDLYWRKILLNQVLQYQPHVVLDLATGSGDVALALQNKGVQVVGMDFSEKLLGIAMQRGLKETLLGDVHQLPFTDQSFDAVTVAFGYRNFSDRAKVQAEVFRVLKRGGRFYILEFSQPYFWFKPFYFIYLRYLMPTIAGWFTGRKEAYVYLNDSIRDFPNVELLKEQMQKAGWSEVKATRLTFGIVAIHEGVKK